MIQTNTESVSEQSLTHLEREREFSLETKSVFVFCYTWGILSQILGPMKDAV